jgi:hypothetical protein
MSADLHVLLQAHLNSDVKDTYWTLKSGWDSAQREDIHTTSHASVRKHGVGAMSPTECQQAGLLIVTSLSKVDKNNLSKRMSKL